jgi:antirestriction protein ArdC
MPSPNEIRQAITNKIITALRNGDLPPWRRAWSSDPNCGAPKSALTKRPYNGINVLLLTLASMEKGYQSRWWATYRQVQQLGGYVRRGEKSTRIILYRPYIKPVTTDDGEEKEEHFCIMKTWCVFNVEQTVGLEHLWPGQASHDGEEVEQRFAAADAAIEAAIEGMGVELRHDGNSAHYSPSGDYIQMPHRHQFSMPEYYETICHETCHATEHPERLNCDRSLPENSYEFLELRAELGGVFCAAQLGLPTAENLENHTAYLKSWLEQMENDAKFIFRAASQASKAADYILSFSQESVEEPEAVTVI